jgi:hypothetical protein
VGDRAAEDERGVSHFARILRLLPDNVEDISNEVGSVKNVSS